MKIKQLTVAALAAVATLVITSCKDDLEIIVEYPETALSVASDAVDFEADGGTKTVRVTSTGDWTVSTDADWLTVTKTSATVLTITAAENEEKEARQATVSVNAADKTGTITVNQAEKVFTIMGEWFDDSSSESMKVFGTERFHEDGTLTGWMAAANYVTSLYGDYEGTYTYTGNTLTLKYNHPITGENTTEVYEVQQLDEYLLMTYLASSSATSELHRIVDSYTLAVGQNRQMAVDDSKFIATEYTSSDKAIASVDAQGNIVAQKRGTAYVSAKSAIGTAVVRVTVEDSDNVIDDFFSFLGGSIDDVTRTYGSLYFELPSDSFIQRLYGIIDEYVESAIFSYWANTVQAIEVHLRQSADCDAIQSSFDKKYTKTAISGQYLAEKNGKTYLIALSKGLLVVAYGPYTPPAEYTDADFEPYEGLALLNAAEAAEKLGYTMTDEDWTEGYFSFDLTDNNVFRRVNVIFDEEEEPHEVSSVILTPKTNVTRDMIEPWYQEHYTATDDSLNPYQSNTDPVYYVQFRERTNGSYTVYYTKRKRKS